MRPELLDLKYVIGNIDGSAERVKNAQDFVRKEIDAYQDGRSTRRVVCTVVYAGNIIDPFNANRSFAALSAARDKILTARKSVEMRRVFLIGAAENLLNMTIAQRQEISALIEGASPTDARLVSLLATAREISFGMRRDQRNILNSAVSHYHEDNFWFASIALNKRPPDTLGVIAAAPPASVIPAAEGTINLNISDFQGVIVLRLDKTAYPQMSFIADAEETLARRNAPLPLPLIPGYLTYVGYTDANQRNRIVRANLNPDAIRPS